jgi:hypothetical protein
MSFGVALISFLTPVVDLIFPFGTQNDTFWMIRITFVCLMLWLILLVVALVTQRRRGLLLLVNAPLVFYQPVHFLILITACLDPSYEPVGKSMVCAF